MIQAGGEMLWSEFHELIHFNRNKKKLLDRRKQYIIEPNYKKYDKTDCSNYRWISLSCDIMNDPTNIQKVKKHSNYYGITVHLIFLLKLLLTAF
jgi:hypothetical protein